MKRYLAFILAAVMVIACAGCAPKEEAPSGTGSTVESAETVNLHLGGEPASLDPAFATLGAGGTYAVQLFEGLTTLDKNLGLAKGMASSWTIGENKDGLPLYTFTIRDDAIWSDGKEVTAGDFEYAWKRAVNHATGASGGYLLYPVRGAREILEGYVNQKQDGTTETIHRDPGELGVVAVDEKTLEVTLEGPCPYFLQLLTLPIYAPVREDTVTASPTGWTNTALTCLTNGPYLLKEWNHDQSLSLVVNDNYWNYDKNSPVILHFVLSEDEEAVYADFESGRLMMASAFPAVQREAAGANGTLRVDSRMGVYYYAFNTKKEAMGKPEVRRAISLAVDRAALAAAGDFGYLPAFGLVPYGISDVNRGWDFRKTGNVYFSGEYAYDLAEARQMLADAGYPGGAGLPILIFLTNDTPGHIAIAEKVAKMLQDGLGVTLRVQALGWDDFQAAKAAGDWDLVRSGALGVTRDPYAFMDAFVTGGVLNDGGFSNETFDKAIADSMTEEDEAERIALLHQAEDILMAEAPVLPLTFYTEDILVSPKLRDVVFSAAGYQYFRWAAIRP